METALTTSLLALSVMGIITQIFIGLVLLWLILVDETRSRK
jgi:hypothetical protein